MGFVAIDFEASCLPRDGRSYPIEVGIAAAEGRRSWLIQPHSLWRDWDWSQEAHDLHGIDPAELRRSGRPAHVVFAELRHEIRGRRVVSDSRLDSYWWRTLALAAGDPVASPVEYVGSVLDQLGATTEQILCAQREVDAINLPRHRAADDALWLWTLLVKLERACNEPIKGIASSWHSRIPHLPEFEIPGLAA